MKARIILRESIDSLKEGYGFDIQREDCISFAGKHGLEVVKEHQLVESSSAWKRDKFEAVIDEAIRQRDEIPAMIFPRVDRFARNLQAAGYYLGKLRLGSLIPMFAQEELRVDNETSAITVLMFFIHSFKADQDGRQMKHNLLKGREDLAEKVGQVPNGAVIWPFDYHPKKVYGQMATGRPSVNEQRADWVRKWAKSILEEGAGINAIEKWMDNEGIRTKRGRKITAKMVSDILRSRQLVGEFHWKGKLYLKDENLRILPDEQFEALQKRLDENRAKSYYNAVKWDYPPLPDVFHGCGERMKRIPLAARNGKKVAYYRCPKCRGLGRSIQAQPVWDVLHPKIELELLREERLIPAVSAEFGNKDTIDQLEYEIKTKDSQIRKWDEDKDAAFRLGMSLRNYPMERVQEQVDKAEANIHRLKAEKSVLENQLSTIKEQRMNEEGIRRLCRLVAGNLANLSKTQWQMLLKRLGLKVIIHSKDDITVRVALPPIRKSEIEFNQFLSAIALDRAFTSICLWQTKPSPERLPSIFSCST